MKDPRSRYLWGGALGVLLVALLAWGSWHWTYQWGEREGEFELVFVSRGDALIYSPGLGAKEHLTNWYGHTRMTRLVQLDAALDTTNGAVQDTTGSDSPIVSFSTRDVEVRYDSSYLRFPDDGIGVVELLRSGTTTVTGRAGELRDTVRLALREWNGTLQATVIGERPE